MQKNPIKKIKSINPTQISKVLSSIISPIYKLKGLILKKLNLPKYPKSFFQGIATLTGLTMGAGILAIPYAVSKSGIIPGLFFLFVLGFAVLMLNLMVGEISLRTEGRHELTAYAYKYLGKFGGYLMYAILIIGIYGSIAAYLIGMSDILAEITKIQKITAILLIFITFMLIIHYGLYLVRRIEFILTTTLLILFSIILIYISPTISISNYTIFNPTYLMMPYGIILFAFIGSAAIPEVKEELIANKKLIKKSIIIGTIIPFIFYLVFLLVVLGSIGEGITEVATISLGRAYGTFIAYSTNILALISMGSSFAALGLALKWVYVYDAKLNKYLSMILLGFFPLALALSNIAGFAKIIGITGVIAGGLEGILLILIHQRAKHRGELKPEYSIKASKVLGVFLALVFLFGIILSIYYWY